MKGECCVGSGMCACGRVGLSALTRWGKGRGGEGSCGNGGKLTLTLNNEIKEADI